MTNLAIRTIAEISTTVGELDDAKRYMVCHMFFSSFLVWTDMNRSFSAGLTYGQINHNLTSQAATLSTHGLPNDVLSNLNPFTLIIVIPICDWFVRLILVDSYMGMND